MASAARALVRDLLWLVAIVAAAAGLLRVLDLLPLSLGEPASGRPFAQIGDVERRFRERLVRPAYFPETLQWPPSRIRVASGRPAVVVLAFRGRGGGPERLFLGQSVGGVASVPERLWPGGVVLASEPAQVGEAPATLERILGEDGHTWYELRWELFERQLRLRSAGSRAELFTFAHSMRKEGP